MDKRILNSEQRLKESFIDLMKKNDPSEITVKRLCTDAGLNRSTFYDRFGYLDRLIESIINDCMDSVCEAGEVSIAAGIQKENISKEEIRAYIERYRSNDLLVQFSKSKQSGKYFYFIIKALVRISMKSRPDTVGYYPAFFQNSGVLSILLEWINNGQDVSEEQIIDIIQEFSRAMFHKYEC